MRLLRSFHGGENSGAQGVFTVVAPRVLPTPFRVDTSGFTLSPDGKTIYLGRSDTESDVWMVERRR